MRLHPDEVFEVRHYSMRGRTGRLRTKRGYLDTPALLPVIDIDKQPVPAGDIQKLGFRAVITNSYLLLQRGYSTADVHELLGFQNTVMTDSGAYQLLEFGRIRSSQTEIVRFQEDLNVDIGVMLDTPTGATASWETALKTVELTTSNAASSIAERAREDVLWVGPVQGGRFLDLIRKSALEMSSLPFHIHALGSPTLFLTNYDYTTIFDMIQTAKQQLPPARPLHLFGAGHPSILPFFVALGVDLFDSASYALFARRGKYMTPRRSIELSRLEDFPCACEVCRKYNPREVRRAEHGEREYFLAKHNLAALAAEVSATRNAIAHDTLWDLLLSRRYSHPALFQAFEWFRRRRTYFSKYVSATGVRAQSIFYYNEDRPETIAFRERIFNYLALEKNPNLVILTIKEKPYSSSKLVQAAVKADLGRVVVNDDTYGLVPIELDQMFPILQTERVKGIKPGIRRLIRGIERLQPTKIIIVENQYLWQELKRHGYRAKHVSATSLQH